MLSRYKDERIVIGHDIVITVVDVNSERVRLGIAAPRAVPIWRQEIYDTIARENAVYQARRDAEERLKRNGGA